jgi:hypothetical protein
MAVERFDNWRDFIFSLVMPGLVPGIHVLAAKKERRGWPGQARP